MEGRVQTSSKQVPFYLIIEYITSIELHRGVDNGRSVVDCTSTRMELLEEQFQMHKRSILAALLTVETGANS